MRSRTNALLVTVISVTTVLFYWVGAAVLALTALRQGAKEAVLLWFWAILPAVVIASMGEVAPVAVLTNALIAGLVLRATLNLSAAFLVVVLVSLLFAGVSALLQPEWLTMIEQQLEKLFSQLGESMPKSGSELVLPNQNQILSMLSLFNALVTSAVLLAARAMQAALDNPGGFQREFHQLRLPTAMAGLLALVSLGVALQSSDNIAWAYLVALPLIMAGLALVHDFVVCTGRTKATLVAVYVSLIIIGPVKLLIALAGFVDSWVGLRSKFPKPPENL